MTPKKCSAYADLETGVQDTLAKLAKTTAAQLAAFRAHDQSRVMRLDKELELTMGAKERSLGALRQHVKDHKCWPPK